MRKKEPVYGFDERGMPTLAKKWHGELPEIPTFEETDSGNRRRGELEILVDYVVKEWLSDAETESSCSAEYIAQRCVELDGRPASVASVRRILQLWKEWNYAELFEKPNGFACFSEYGIETGLDEIHRRVTRARKREKAAIRRGERAYTAIPKDKLRANRKQ